MKLQTPRLELIAATPELVKSEMQDFGAFAASLGVQVPNSWPPEFIDLQTQTFTLQKLESGLEQANWWSWYLVLKAVETTSQPLLIGIAGFKGPPDAAQSVEIGYTVAGEFQNQGLASEAVGALVSWAWSQDVKSVRAETLPELAASIRVLEKNGFVCEGETAEPGVVGYRKDCN